MSCSRRYQRTADAGLHRVAAQRPPHVVVTDETDRRQLQNGPAPAQKRSARRAQDQRGSRRRGAIVRE
jgi:hypothetical protein